MRIVACQSAHIVREHVPEAVNDKAADGCAMQEVADAGESILGTPDAGTEPSQEANADESFDLLFQRRDVRRSHPVCAVAGFTDHPVHFDTSGGKCIGSIECVL